jgi:hypothetical protein
VGEAVKKDDEEKLIPVGPGADELNEAGKDEPPEDERLAQKDDAEEPEGEAGAGGERRRESAKERRGRLKKQHARERLERDFLLKRNEELEKRFMAMESRQSHTETAAIDQRITSVKAQVTNAERVLTEALKKPNGAGAEEFGEALRIRDELRDQLAALNGAKAHRGESAAGAESAEPRQRAAPQEAKPDPRVIRNAREWAGDHEWFDFNGEDEDSRIVRALDESLSAEGYDPTSKEYWEELSARVKRRLPEHFKKGAKARPDDEGDMDDEDPIYMNDGESRVRIAGPKFSSGGRERPLKKGEVYVSAERKQAMKEYGVWEDPVARNRMLKKYAKWDAESAAQPKSR